VRSLAKELAADNERSMNILFKRMIDSQHDMGSSDRGKVCRVRAVDGNSILN